MVSVFHHSVGEYPTAPWHEYHQSAAPYRHSSACGARWITFATMSARLLMNQWRLAENSLNGSIHFASNRSTANIGISPTSDRTP